LEDTLRNIVPIRWKCWDKALKTQNKFIVVNNPTCSTAQQIQDKREVQIKSKVETSQKIHK